MMKSVGENADANLAQHFFTTSVGAEVTEETLAEFKTLAVPAGCIVIGTAPGDWHSLGKRIVGGCLKSLLVAGGAPFRFDPNLYKAVGAEGWPQRYKPENIVLSGGSRPATLRVMSAKGIPI